MVPSCDSCNASKCNLEVSTWIRRKRLDERAFLERHLAVSAELASRFSPEVVASVPGQGGDLDDLAVAEG